MKRTSILLTLLASTTLVLVASCVSHESVTTRKEVVRDRPVATSRVVPLPPPREEVVTVAPSPSHVWVRGYWVQQGPNWVWRPGHWEYF
jgi:hypothetical protein